MFTAEPQHEPPYTAAPVHLAAIANPALRLAEYSCVPSQEQPEDAWEEDAGSERAAGVQETMALDSTESKKGPSPASVMTLL